MIIQKKIKYLKLIFQFKILLPFYCKMLTNTEKVITKKYSKPRKYNRIKWSKLQLTILMIQFLKNKFPDIEEISSIRKVKIWFQNTRQRPLNIERLLLTI